AAALFIERATAVRPDFAVTAETAPAVAAICRRLDGLPLALELAAARVKVLPPPALLARLGNRLALLTGGRRDAPARQQTLRATLDWSHEQLDGAERALFRRLAVFAAGCPLDAAEAVCVAGGQRPQVLEDLGALVDHSLLYQEERAGDLGEPRFRMLETVREYALERLDASGEAAAVDRAHAAHYLALAEQAAPADLVWAGRPRDPAVGRFEGEAGNLQAALRWLERRGPVEDGLRLATVLSGWWEVRGDLGEGRRWLAVFLAHAAGATPARAQGLDAAGALAAAQGDRDTARALLR